MASGNPISLTMTSNGSLAASFRALATSVATRTHRCPADSSSLAITDARYQHDPRRAKRDLRLDKEAVWGVESECGPMLVISVAEARYT